MIFSPILVALAVILATTASSEQIPRGSEHDFHVSHANLAVEDNVAMLRIRFFRDDLEAALSQYNGNADFRMDSTALADSVFRNYFVSRASLSSGDEVLEPRIVTSGEDESDREPVWWYVLRFDSDSSITTMTMTNTLLLEVFDDQKNIVRVAHFPDDTRRSFYFARGEETAVFNFR